MKALNIKEVLDHMTNLYNRKLEEERKADNKAKKVGGDAVFSGIFELIICLVLYCGASQYNFCCVLYYMIMALLNIVTRFSFLGFLVQVKIQGTMIDWS